MITAHSGYSDPFSTHTTIQGQMPYPYVYRPYCTSREEKAFEKRAKEILEILKTMTTFKETEDLTLAEAMLYHSYLYSEIEKESKKDPFNTGYELLQKAAGIPTSTALSTILCSHPLYPTTREKILQMIKERKDNYETTQAKDLLPKLIAAKTFREVETNKSLETLVSFKPALYDALIDRCLWNSSTDDMENSIALTDEGKPANALAEVFYFRRSAKQQPEKAEETHTVKKIRAAIPNIKEQIKIISLETQFGCKVKRIGGTLILQIQTPDDARRAQERADEIFDLLNGKTAIPGDTKEAKAALLEEAVMLKTFLKYSLLKKAREASLDDKGYELIEDALGLWKKTALSKVFTTDRAFATAYGVRNSLHEILLQNMDAYEKAKAKKLLPILQGKQEFPEKEIGLSFERVVLTLKDELIHAIEDDCISNRSIALLDEALNTEQKTALAQILASDIATLEKLKPELIRRIEQETLKDNKTKILTAIQERSPYKVDINPKTLDLVAKPQNQTEELQAQQRAKELYETLEGEIDFPDDETIQEEAIMLKEYLFDALKIAANFIGGIELLRQAISLDESTKKPNTALSKVFHHNPSSLFSTSTAGKIQKIIQKREKWGGESSLIETDDDPQSRTVAGPAPAARPRTPELFNDL